MRYVRRTVRDYTHPSSLLGAHLGTYRISEIRLEDVREVRLD